MYCGWRGQGAGLIFTTALHTFLSVAMIKSLSTKSLYKMLHAVTRLWRRFCLKGKHDIAQLTAFPSRDATDQQSPSCPPYVFGCFSFCFNRKSNFWSLLLVFKKKVVVSQTSWVPSLFPLHPQMIISEISVLFCFSTSVCTGGLGRGGRNPTGSPEEMRAVTLRVLFWKGFNDLSDFCDKFSFQKKKCSWIERTATFWPSESKQVLVFALRKYCGGPRDVVIFCPLCLHPILLS